MLSPSSWRPVAALALVAGLSAFIGCNGGDGNPLAGDPASDGGASPTVMGEALFTPEVTQVAEGLYTGSGVLGVYQVTLNGTTGAADLVPIRTAQGPFPLGTSVIVDVTNYMGGMICPDCVRVGGIGRPFPPPADPADPDIMEITIEARHPIPLPPQGGEPGPKDRLDLHVHDLQGIVVAEGDDVFQTKAKVVRGDSIVRNNVRMKTDLLANADGYTSHLDPDIDNFYPTNSNVHPYKIFFQDAANGNYNPALAPVNGYPDLWNPTGHNVFPMGSDYRGTPFQFYVRDGELTEFLLVVSCSYGVSSTGLGTTPGKRMNPRYFLPLFNQKEAWKVETTVSANGLVGSAATTSATVDLAIYDWQQDAVVDTFFNASTSNLSRIDRPSKVRNVEIEVPGLGFSGQLGPTAFSGTGQLGDPLEASVVINNAALAPGGSYWGLVAVRDDLEGVDTTTVGLMKDLRTVFDLRDFSTYQTFSLDVAVANGAPNAVIQTNPSPASVGQGTNIVFDGSFSTDDGVITQYLWDFHYSGNPQSFTVEATGAIANYAYDEPGALLAALVVVDDNNPALQDIAVVPVSITCPTPAPVGCAVGLAPVYSGYSASTNWTPNVGKMDLGFRGDGSLVIEDNGVLGSASTGIGTNPSFTPFVAGYPGVTVGSIDVDRRDYVIWVEWLHVNDFFGLPILTTAIGPLEDKHRGMDQYLKVFDPATGLELEEFDMGTPIHAVDTDAFNNIYVITAEHVLWKINNDLTPPQPMVDLDVVTGRAPTYNIGQVFDMAIDFESNAIFVLTNGLYKGTLDQSPNYGGGSLAIVWRFECDGGFNPTTAESHPNPATDMLVIPPAGYPFANLLGFDMLADIEVDNFGGVGYGTALNGEQKCQVLVAGSGLVAGEGIRVATSMARLDANLGQISSTLFETTVGMRAFGIKPDGNNQVIGIAGDINSPAILEYYTFTGGWQ